METGDSVGKSPSLHLPMAAISRPRNLRRHRSAPPSRPFPTPSPHAFPLPWLPASPPVPGRLPPGRPHPLSVRSLTCGQDQNDDVRMPSGGGRMNGGAVLFA